MDIKKMISTLKSKTESQLKYKNKMTIELNEKISVALNNLPFFIMTFKCAYNVPENDYIGIATTLKEAMNDPLISSTIKELFVDAFYTVPKDPEEVASVFMKFMNTLTGPNLHEEIKNKNNK